MKDVVIEFKDNLIDFFNELIDQLPDVPELVLIRLFLINQVEPTQLIETFNYNIHKNQSLLRNMLKSRNESFFLDGDPFGLSSDLQKGASKLKNIWRSPALSDEDRDVIWQWMDSLMSIADRYTKQK